MALPTAIFAMIAVTALGSVAVLSSVEAQRGTARDHDSKEAIAAADAGANIALLRLNRFQSSISAVKPCIGPAGETRSPRQAGARPPRQKRSVAPPSPTGSAPSARRFR